MSDDLTIPAIAGPQRPSYRVDRPAGGLDAGTKRLLMFAGVAIVALLALVAVWSFAGRGPPVAPVIEADPRPLRTKPDNPGGMQVAGAEEQDTGAPAMAPAPEAPAPLALRAQAQAARPPAPESPTAPTASPAASPTASPAASPAAAPTAARAAAPPASAPAGLDARPAPRPAGGTMVQLASVDTEEAAHAEWRRLGRKLPDLLGARQLVVQKAEADGRVKWRVRTGGFADIADATGFCGKVRAKGAGCTIASF